MRTVPPRTITQLRPARLTSASYTRLPRISSRWPQGTDSRVASSRQSPTPQTLPDQRCQCDTAGGDVAPVLGGCQRDAVVAREEVEDLRFEQGHLPTGLGSARVEALLDAQLVAIAGNAPAGDEFDRSLRLHRCRGAGREMQVVDDAFEPVTIRVDGFSSQFITGRGAIGGSNTILAAFGRSTPAGRGRLRRAIANRFGRLTPRRRPCQGCVPKGDRTAPPAYHNPMTASPPTPPTGDLVLCVDLDGTLLRGDTLLETAIELLKRSRGPAAVPVLAALRARAFQAGSRAPRRDRPAALVVSGRSRRLRRAQSKLVADPWLWRLRPTCALRRRWLHIWADSARSSPAMAA